MRGPSSQPNSPRTCRWRRSSRRPLTLSLDRSRRASTTHRCPVSALMRRPDRVMARVASASTAIATIGPVGHRPAAGRRPGTGPRVPGRTSPAAPPPGASGSAVADAGRRPPRSASSRPRRSRPVAIRLAADGDRPSCSPRSATVRDAGPGHGVQGGQLQEAEVDGRSAASGEPGDEVAPDRPQHEDAVARQAAGAQLIPGRLDDRVEQPLGATVDGHRRAPRIRGGPVERAVGEAPRGQIRASLHIFQTSEAVRFGTVRGVARRAT